MTSNTPSVATWVHAPVKLFDFLRSQPGCVAYAERMRVRFFPELGKETS